MSTLPFPTIDGYMLDTKQRCNMRYKALAIEQFQALRRSRAFRTKQWTVPNDINSFPIPANDSYEYQVWMKPGSAIWGYTFTGDATAGGNGGIDSFQVTETCTNVPLFSEFVTKQPEEENFFGVVWSRQQYLSELLIVPSPGLLHVEIATTAPVNRNIQLVLWGGEPA